MKLYWLLPFLLPGIPNAGGQQSTTGKNIAPNHLAGQRWLILQQCFASHDRESTLLDTVRAHPGDYIDFAGNGLAYGCFLGLHDTLEYELLGRDSLSFGDTPFRVIRNDNGNLVLYQNEEEKNGDYNRAVYILSREEEI